MTTEPLASTPEPGLERAAREAVMLIDEFNERRASRKFYGIDQGLHAKVCTVRATLARALANVSPTPPTAFDRAPKHHYWGAGEPDCPKEIRAGNGELCRLRCKVCGLDNPRDPICHADALFDEAEAAPAEPESKLAAWMKANPHLVPGPDDDATPPAVGEGEVRCEHGIRSPHPCDDCLDADIPPGKSLTDHPCWGLPLNRTGMAHRYNEFGDGRYCQRCGTEIEGPNRRQVDGTRLHWKPRASAPARTLATLRPSPDAIREALETAVRDLSATYEALKDGTPTISIGQWRRLDALRAALSATPEGRATDKGEGL